MARLPRQRGCALRLVLPHVLLRLPYGPDTVPVEAFDFVEDVDGTDHRKYLWGNAVYSLGQRITHAFALYSWCGAIRGVEGGGLVEGLPAHLPHRRGGYCPQDADGGVHHGPARERAE